MLDISNTQVPPPSNWQKFEHLCWRLWQEIWQDPNAQKNGRSGQPQCGVDVFRSPRRGKSAGVQCKGKDNYQEKVVTETELIAEVNKAKNFRPLLSRFILATTAPRDAELQRVARELTEAHRKEGLFSVHIFSWDDIREELAKHEHLVSELYVGAAYAKDGRALCDTISGLFSEFEKKQRSQHDQHLQTVLRTTFLSTAFEGERERAMVSGGVTEEQFRGIMAILQSDSAKAATRHPRTRPSVTILDADRRRTLGIICTSPIPLMLAHYESIFPDIDWTSGIQFLRQRHLVEIRDELVYVPHRIRAPLTRSSEEANSFLQMWIDALEPLKWHPDTSLYLGLQLLSAGRIADAIKTISEAADSLVTAYWNKAYLSVLLAIDRPSALRQIPPHDRAVFLNALGNCLTGAHRFEEAVHQFRRLRSHSERHNDNWGIGQSHHNCGIALFELGDLKRAEGCFRQAVSHTRKTDDHFLLGRSLYQLALTLIYLSRGEEARTLLQESETVKVATGDDLIGINYAQAALAAQEGDFEEAIRSFKKAERLATKIGHFHARALAKFNIGKAYLDGGQLREAKPHLEKALELAEADGLEDVELFAVGGLAMLHERRDEHVAAEKAFRRLFDLHMRTKNFEEASNSMHDVGILLQRQGRFKEATGAFTKAMQFARRCASEEGIYLCQSGRARVHSAMGDDKGAITALRRAAAFEQRNKSFSVAARLWWDVLSQSIVNDESPSRITDAFERCKECAKSSARPDALVVQAHAEMHLWRWSRQEYRAAIEALIEMRGHAEAAGDDASVFMAENQLAVCFIELDRVKEAVPRLRKALRIARRLNRPADIEMALNNLGMALRDLNRYADAIRALEEAEQIARSRSDTESAISIRHNRAITIQHQRRFDDAEKTLRQCRDEARKHGSWREYVKALHGLANVAWHRGRGDIALRRYKSALAAAKHRDVTDGRHGICLNYANALHWNGDLALARDILNEAVSDLPPEMDACIYHSELASLHSELGDAASAIIQWELAQEGAQRTGDSYHVALSAGALAGLHQAGGNLDDADAQYALAIESEADPSLRAQLLVQRLELLLQMERTADASKTFEELQDLPRDEAKEEYVDGLLVLGEHNMEDNSPAEAMKAYMAAMLACIESDAEQYFRIGARAAIELSQLNAKSLTVRIGAVERSTRKWIEQQLACTAESDEFNVMFWPFEAAKRIARRSKTQPNLGRDEVGKILEQAVNEITTDA